MRDSENIQPLIKDAPPELVHGSVSRYGGVSCGPYASNNISFGVGDEESKVAQNRAAIKRRFGIEYLVSAHQVHGSRIHQVKPPVTGDFIVDGADALITNVPGVGLMIGHADCQPVVIHDPVNRAVAAIHSGWRGSVVDIVGKTVAAMQEKFNSRPETLLTGIGPSLGPCCAEFVNYQEELPVTFQRHMVSDHHFDFWQITGEQLRRCGVREEAISCVGVCTRCCPDYFSYRRAGAETAGITGRNATVIAVL